MLDPRILELAFDKSKKPSFDFTNFYGINWGHPLAKGLAGCWMMNKGIGGTVFDLSGNGNNGTFINNAAWVTTEKGFGTQFPTDGGTDRINLGSITSVNDISGYRTQEITFASRLLWNNAGTSSYPRLFDKSDGGSFANGWGVQYNGGLKISAGSIVRTVAPISPNVWYDYVGVLKSGDQRAYLDGVLVDTDPNALTFPPDTTNAAIGNWNHDVDRQWDGYIVYVYIWNRALLSSEIAWLHREPYAMIYPDFMPLYMKVAAAGVLSIPRPLSRPFVGPLGGI